jgi:regulator of sigma E protease
VLNLLPIPVLDGGHFMYYMVEILTGKPVSEAVMNIGQRIGFFLLGSMMILAFYNDINRLITG